MSNDQLLIFDISGKNTSARFRLSNIRIGYFVIGVKE